MTDHDTRTASGRPASPETTHAPNADDHDALAARFETSTVLAALIELRGPIALWLAGFGALAIGDVFACLLLHVAGFAWVRQLHALWQAQLDDLHESADILDVIGERLQHASDLCDRYEQRLLEERASSEVHASINYDRGYADAIDHVNETLERRGSLLRVEDHRTYEAPN